mmetsp:Transcript_51686/g.121347  ORF Transcript_51686/g.121347 Transcript_51686/m.121347 type:complete len:726 (+) Transcript_51686:164-2341(+)
MKIVRAAVVVGLFARVCAALSWHIIPSKSFCESLHLRGGSGSERGRGEKRPRGLSPPPTLPPQHDATWGDLHDNNQRLIREMTAEEQRSFFSLQSGEWDTVLTVPVESRSTLIDMLRGKDEALHEAEAKLSAFLRELPDSLDPLTTWMQTSIRAPTLSSLPDHPLYWRLDKRFTEAAFPGGFITFLGITGGGKTRRLVETINNEKCIFLAFATDENAGSKATLKVIKRLQSYDWTDVQQKYFWMALLFAFSKFHARYIEGEEDGTLRVRKWAQVSEFLNGWIDEIPDPPQTENIEKALQILRGGVDQRVRLLIDEVQVVPDKLQQEFMSVCFAGFDNVVVTGTGVSVQLLNAAIDATLRGSNAAKADSVMPVDGPPLLCWDQVISYWSDVGAANLTALVENQGYRMKRWFKFCRARVAAVAVQIYKASGSIEAVEEELFKLTDPDHSRGWIRKNDISLNAEIVFNGHTLAFILARAFLGATWFRHKTQHQTPKKNLEGRQYLTSIGVAPLVTTSVREFAVMECLRRTPVVMCMLPVVMKKFLEDGEAMDASAAGYAFEKAVALALMQQQGLPTVKVCNDVMEILKPKDENREALYLLWPEWYMGPDLILRLNGTVTVYQCKYCDGLPQSVKGLRYIVETTNLNKTYLTENGTFFPPRSEQLSEDIRDAAKVLTVERCLVLKHKPGDAVMSSVRSLGADVEVAVLDENAMKVTYILRKWIHTPGPE